MLGLLAGCRTVPPPALSRYEFAEPHMWTLWHITLYASDEATARAAVRAAFARVAKLDEMMTDYVPDSELVLLSYSPPNVPVKVSDDLFDVIQNAQAIARQTDGAFDMTVGPLVQLWRRAKRQQALPPADRLAEAWTRVGWQKLQLDPRNKTVTLLAPNMRLDLGGIAKGYAADAALRVLREKGLTRALVAASGDLAIGDPPPGKRGWRVGIGEVDGKTNGVATLLLLHNAGVSTSGDMEQFVELNGIRYSHIVDPGTGRGLTNRLQATIIADCTTRSDALATAVCVAGPERGLKVIDADARTAAFLLLPTAGTNRGVFKSRQFQQMEARSR